MYLMFFQRVFYFSLIATSRKIFLMWLSVSVLVVKIYFAWVGRSFNLRTFTHTNTIYNILHKCWCWQIHFFTFFLVYLINYMFLCFTGKLFREIQIPTYTVIALTKMGRNRAFLVDYVEEEDYNICYMLLALYNVIFFYGFDKTIKSISLNFYLF